MSAQMHTDQASILQVLENTIKSLAKEFHSISTERETILNHLTQFIQQKVTHNEISRLNFICTHNSRRSHIAQLWAQAAAFYYGVPGVECFSGGTEATAFNFRAVKAMQIGGFDITALTHDANPYYEAVFSTRAKPVILFSKKYDDPFNPAHDFAAIMTCSHASENCPVVMGASARIALTYDDPKEFDGTELEESKYSEKVREIGKEILFAFSGIKV
jgi:arsenate reductase